MLDLFVRTVLVSFVCSYCARFMKETYGRVRDFLRINIARDRYVRVMCPGLRVHKMALIEVCAIICCVHVQIIPWVLVFH
jgi:hypothetical protein